MIHLFIILILSFSINSFGKTLGNIELSEKIDELELSLATKNQTFEDYHSFVLSAEKDLDAKKISKAQYNAYVLKNNAMVDEIELVERELKSLKAQLKKEVRSSATKVQTKQIPLSPQEQDAHKAKCDLETYPIESFQCDQATLDITKDIIDMSKISLRTVYSKQQFPQEDNIEETIFLDQIQKLAELITLYNQCQNTISGKNICLSRQAKSNYWIHKSKYDEATKNGDTSTANYYEKLMDDFQEAFNKCTSCELEIPSMYYDTYGPLKSILTDKQFLNFTDGKCLAEIPDRRFSYFVHHSNEDRIIMTKLKGVLNLKTKTTCQMNGRASIVTSRKIVITPKVQHPKKSHSRLTILDEWDNIDDAESSGHSRYPLALRFSLKEDVQVSYHADHILYMWGEQVNAPYLKISNTDGHVISSNIFNNSLNQQCKTNSQLYGNTKKIIPDLQINKSHGFIQNTIAK